MTEAAGSRRRRAVAARRNGVAGSGAGERATTVLLVDPHAWSRETFARGLEMASRDLRVLRFADLSEFAGAEPQTGAAVVLLNLTGMALGDRRVSSAIAAIRSSLPDLPLTVFSDDDDAEAILNAIERGVRGYVPMSLELQVVAHVLQFVAAGGTFLPAELLLTNLQAAAADDLPVIPPAAGEPTPAVTVSRLTPGELGVIELVRQGKSDEQIARELNTHEATVKVQVCHVMRKFGAVNRTQVALLAARLMG